MAAWSGGFLGLTDCCGPAISQSILSWHRVQLKEIFVTFLINHYIHCRDSYVANELIYSLICMDL